MKKHKAAPAAFRQHNHGNCTDDALEFADKQARDAGLRLTPVRRRTLEVLLENHHAMGAYDVLERLAEDGFGTSRPWHTVRWIFWCNRAWPIRCAA